MEFGLVVQQPQQSFVHFSLALPQDSQTLGDLTIDLAQINLFRGRGQDVARNGYRNAAPGIPDDNTTLFIQRPSTAPD